MKALLTKIALHRAVGLYLGEHEATVCKAASTPLGPVLVESKTEPYTQETLAGVIEQLLSPLIGTKVRMPVAVGLAGSRLFFGTRMTRTDGSVTPEAELAKALYSSNLSADDLEVDLLRGRLNKLPVARILACRTKYISGLVGILGRLGVRPVRAEPATCALVRLAERLHGSPRRSKTVLRIFLGASQGLAVVVSGGLPIAWRTFVLPEFSESFAILSAMRGLETQRTHYGIESRLEYAIIHGRPDLHERLQQEQLPSEMKTRVIWEEGPAFEGADVAFGLALGCFSQEVAAFDLSRKLKARAPIKEIFPWKELAFTSTLVVGMGLVLGAHSMKLDDSLAALKAENSQYTCLAGGDLGKLEKDKKDLEKKTESVQKFVDTRVLWTAYTEYLSRQLPAEAVINTFKGQNALNVGGKTKTAAGSLTIRGKAPLLDTGAIPREVDAFLVEVAKDPQWRRDFPSVTTDMRLAPAAATERPSLNFEILGEQVGKGKAAKKG